MDKILEIDKLPKLTSGRMKNLNGLKTSKEIEWVINSLATKKSLGHLGFTGKLCQTYKKLIPSLQKHFHKIKDEETLLS